MNSRQPERNAKSERHEDLPTQAQKRYQHSDITDNRVLWEVLEDADGQANQ